MYVCVRVHVYIYFKWSYSTPGDNVPFDHSYLLKKHVHNIELSQMRVVSKGQGDRESLGHSLSASKTFPNTVFI